MELADVVDSKSTGGDTVPVRVRPPAPRRSKVRFASIFLYKKIIRPLPCFSFVTKILARLVCFVVNACATTHRRYQLFVSLIFYINTNTVAGAKLSLLRFFYAKKSFARFLASPLLRKIICTIIHNPLNIYRIPPPSATVPLPLGKGGFFYAKTDH